MLEEPRTNIEVRMTIPSETYMAAAYEIMSQYSDVVKDALNDIKEKLMFDKSFQKEIKFAVQERLQNAVKDGIKRAAESVAWNIYLEHSKDIEKMVRDMILSDTQK